MRASPGCTILQLPPFTLEETQLFLAAVLEREANPKRLGKVVWEITGGWPLYAEQVEKGT